MPDREWVSADVEGNLPFHFKETNSATKTTPAAKSSTSTQQTIHSKNHQVSQNSAQPEQSSAGAANQSSSQSTSTKPSSTQQDVDRSGANAEGSEWEQTLRAELQRAGISENVNDSRTIDERLRDLEGRVKELQSVVSKARDASKGGGNR